MASRKRKKVLFTGALTLTALLVFGHKIESWLYSNSVPMEPYSVPMEPWLYSVPMGPVEPMALSLSYWEQTANALSNLMDLQCWAKTVNISKVLQPSIDLYNKSAFRFSAWDSGHDKLEFEDLFDIQHWNNMSLRYDFAQLVSLDYFLKHAVRDIVVVNIKCNYENFACPNLEYIKSHKPYKFLTSKGFKFHKSVCVDFKTGPHIITPKAFREQIFRSTGSNVSIMFSTWTGIRKDYRVALNGTCISSFSKFIRVGVGKNPVTTLKYKENSAAAVAASDRVSSIIDEFISRYMSGEKYIAIMIRTEKLHRSNKTLFTIPPDKNFCAQAIISDWRKMAEEKGIKKTLVLSDIGEHGSARWHSLLALNFSKYIQSNVKTEHHIAEINRAFEELTGSPDSVQIAILHQQLVARATGAILVGGGRFQMMTLNLHLYNHRGEECVALRTETCDKGYVGEVSGQILA